MHILKIHSLSTGGAHSQALLAVPYLAKQLTTLFHTQTKVYEDKEFYQLGFQVC